MTKLLASENTYVRSEDKLVAAIGINDLVIVSTKDAVLVASKNAAQDVKQITQALQDELRSEWLFHRENIDSGGKYDTVDAGERYHEADYRQSWGEAECSATPSQSRALGRRVRIRQSDKWRPDVFVVGNHLDLHPDRGDSCA